MFTRTSILAVALLAVLVDGLHTGQVIAQPMPVPVVVQQVVQPAPAPVPPAMIGIAVTPVTVRVGNAAPFAAVRVDTDTLKRPLLQPNGFGGWNTFQFRTGFDVIRGVNGVGVNNAAGVTANLVKGWNKIVVYDTGTGVGGEYHVHCD